jgi:SAM-dependent methyltransferase
MSNISPKSALKTEADRSGDRIEFYKKTIETWVIDKEASILIVGGGETDRQIFTQLGFKNVVISNLNAGTSVDDFQPYKWSLQQAENLGYGESEFDFVIVHAALHHCQSPHRALLEMYRVARISVIAFESRDSFLIKMLEKINVTPSYEHMAVYANNGQFGGVNNTNIPNYIFRWTEREIEKTINTYCPQLKHSFAYNYGNHFPFSLRLERNAGLQITIAQVAQPFYKVFAQLFKRQQNLFAFRVNKPANPHDLQEWLEIDGDKLRFSETWAKKFYKY